MAREHKNKEDMEWTIKTIKESTIKKAKGPTTKKAKQHKIKDAKEPKTKEPIMKMASESNNKETMEWTIKIIKVSTT